MCGCSAVSSSLQPHGQQPSRLLCPWDFPGKTGMGYQFLLQRIFSTQGLNPHLRHRPAHSLSLRHLGSPYKRDLTDAKARNLLFIMASYHLLVRNPHNSLSSNQTGTCSIKINSELMEACISLKKQNQNRHTCQHFLQIQRQQFLLSFSIIV